MTKIDIAPHEETSTSIDAALAERMAKMMDDQNKMLERMGACLTRLEESRFKKGTRNLKNSPQKPLP